MNAPRPGTILVVEDDPMLRELIAFMMSAQGYAIVEAADGRQAIQALDKQGADSGLSLMLLDLMMPGVDGLGVLQHRAEHGYQVPVVAMSASHSQLAAAEQAGAQAVLPKPFEMADLLHMVEHQLTPSA
jgi:CheY-like chemotaxis protein